MKHVWVKDRSAEEWLSEADRRAQLGSVLSVLTAGQAVQVRRQVHCRHRLQNSPIVLRSSLGM